MFSASHEPAENAGPAGLVSFIAQAQFDSVILEAITFASAIVLATRVVLGYKRMNDRWAALHTAPSAAVWELDSTGEHVWGWRPSVFWVHAHEWMPGGQLCTLHLSAPVSWVGAGSHSSRSACVALRALWVEVCGLGLLDLGCPVHEEVVEALGKSMPAGYIINTSGRSCCEPMHAATSMAMCTDPATTGNNRQVGLWVGAPAAITVLKSLRRLLLGVSSH